MNGSTSLGFNPPPDLGYRIIYMDNEIQSSALDILYANSDSLPAGTEVSVRITVKAKLFGSEAGAGGVNFRGGVSAVNTVAVTDTDPRVGRLIKSVFEFVPIVTGGSWSFTQVLNMSSYIDPGVTVPAASQWTGRSKVFIDALTPGVTLSAASGHDYGTPLAISGTHGGPIAAAVPEPGTWAMLLLGLGAVTTAVRRVTRRPELS